MTVRRPQFAAGLSTRWRRVAVTTPVGTATFETFRPRRVVSELGRWDGTRHFDDLRRSSRLSAEYFDALVAALDRIQAVIDASEPWRYARRFAENPAISPSEVSAEGAYRMSRWVSGNAAGDGRTEKAGGPLERLAAARRSVELGAATEVVPDRAERYGYRACVAAADPETRSIASAGDLRPVHLFMVGAPDLAGLRPLFAFVDSGGVQVGSVEEGDLADAFVPDPGLLAALTAGASVILVAADPAREVMKYGDRGWQYCELESGAHAHHLSLALVEFDCAHRTIGGFHEGRLSRLVPTGTRRLELMLTLVVTGGRTG